MTVTDFTERLRKAGPPSKSSSRWLNLATVVVALVFALVIVHLVAVLTDRTVPALVLARDVGASQPFTESDLATVDLVPDHDVRFVRASDRATVVGRAPAVGLQKGTLLAAASLIPEGVPGPGFQLVGMRVEARPPTESAPLAACASLRVRVAAGTALQHVIAGGQRVLRPGRRSRFTGLFRDGRRRRDRRSRTPRPGSGRGKRFRDHQPQGSVT
ncbi:hypothetical protein [Amycolatopsis sp. EV170708-02-1]|uniref:hypothetical protein n=1 Tax=Amycolatopsis sp. EV170708-02-1 TaxID=2919322 RepID=UPI001F0C15EC|nr:hypothetical protein [Amycolatopsis sp. EV170708-02-1]UMP06705.1 hypothetical protein MJQ72_18685 [Amycolatopsis sp. EV170708-02-1]